MNIFELIIFTAMIAIGLGVSKILYGFGGLWLSVPGFLFCILLVPFGIIKYDRYRKRAYLGDQLMPGCTCGNNDFSYEKIGEDIHLLCQKCKKRYEKYKDKVYIYDDNEKKPYKHLVKNQGWVDW